MEEVFDLEQFIVLISELMSLRNDGSRGHPAVDLIRDLRPLVSED